MINLIIKNRDHIVLKAGAVLHLRILDIMQTSPGKWMLTVEDVTPLPGAEPTGYACGICGIIEPAQEDGSLPEGWTKKDYQEGSMFLCPNCQDVRICRVCGCSEYQPCETENGPCYWVEEDLCSACASKKE